MCRLHFPTFFLIIPLTEEPGASDASRCELGEDIPANPTKIKTEGAYDLCVQNLKEVKTKRNRKAFPSPLPHVLITKGFGKSDKYLDFAAMI